MIAQIQLRRGTTAEWAAAAPVILSAGEPGWDSTLKGMKVGDGSTEWAALPWIDAKNRPDINADTLDGVHLADIRLGQNILHNWDFTNPINQRGFATASGAGYWLDRWTLNQTTGATYTCSNVWGLRALTTTNNILMQQYIENPNAYAGKTVTVSVEIYSASTTAGCTIRLWCNGTTQIGSVGISDGDTGIKSFTATIPSTELTDLSVAFYNYGGNDVRIKRIKLELGTASTLHLDPPMDWAVELPKCQWFLRVLNQARETFTYFGTGYIINATLAQIVLSGLSMRAGVPTVLTNGSFTMRYSGTSQLTVTGINASAKANFNGGIYLEVEYTGSPTLGAACSLYSADGGSILLSREL